MIRSIQKTKAELANQIAGIIGTAADEAILEEIEL